MEQTARLIDGSLTHEDERFKTKKKRMPEQDIAKGICIFAVIFCHCVPVTQTVDIFLRALFGYCMPFFFCIAGYNYHLGDTGYFRQVGKRAKQILLPLLIYSTVIGALMTIFLLITKGGAAAVDELKAYAGLWLTDPLATKLGLPTIGTYTGMQRLFEPYWFCLYLFTGSLIFFAVIKPCMKSKKIAIPVIIGLISLTLIFNIFNIVLPWGLHNAPLFACLMLMGYYFKEKQILVHGLERGWRDINFWISFAVILGSGLAFSRAGQITGSGRVNIVLGAAEVPYTFFYTWFATYFVIMLAGFVRKIKWLTKFYNWYGTNSMLIFMVHLIYVGAAKAICRVDLNTSLGFVEKMSWMDILAFVVANVLVNLHLLADLGIRKLVKKHKAKKALALEANNDTPTNPDDQNPKQ